MSGSNRVATGILASRVVGLLRETILGIALGVGPIADAFRAATRIPNLLQNLLGEGSISAAFVPVYARLVEEGKQDEADDLARRTLGILAAVVVMLVGVILLAARPLVWLTTLGRWTGERYELAIELTRITALGVGFLVLSAWCLGVLNAHRHYLLAYIAPVIWSGAQIVALTLALIVGIEAIDIARWGAIAMVIGSIGQLAVQIPKVRSVGGPPIPKWGLTPPLREVLKRSLPAIGGRGVVQIGSYVDLALAAFLAFGALATISLVMPLYLLSVAVFGFSVAVSELTEMSRTTSGLDAVAARVRAAQRRVLLPAGLVTAGAIGGGSIVIGTIFESLNGQFGGDDASTAFGSANTAVAAATLAAFSIGLPATMVARVSQNALYALGDVRGPARIALVRLGVAAVVGFLCMMQLDHLAAGSLDEAVTRAISDPDVVDAQGTAFTPATFEPIAVSALGEAVGDGPFGTTSVGGFPHWPPWEPLPNRESLVAELTGTDAGNESTARGTIFTHYGPVGLGLGSAVASWTEWYLLRRRLAVRLRGRSVSGGLGRWVAIAGFAAFIMARAVDALALPTLIDLIVLGGAAMATYIGTLWFIGVRPRTAMR